MNSCCLGGGGWGEEGKKIISSRGKGLAKGLRSWRSPVHELGWRWPRSLPGPGCHPAFPSLQPYTKSMTESSNLCFANTGSLPPPSHLRPPLWLRPRHFLPGLLPQSLNWFPCLCLHPVPVCLPLCCQGPLSKRNT